MVPPLACLFLLTAYGVVKLGTFDFPFLAFQPLNSEESGAARSLPRHSQSKRASYWFLAVLKCWAPAGRRALPLGKAKRRDTIMIPPFHAGIQQENRAMFREKRGKSTLAIALLSIAYSGAQDKTSCALGFDLIGSTAQDVLFEFVYLPSLTGMSVKIRNPPALVPVLSMLRLGNPDTHIVPAQGLTPRIVVRRETVYRFASVGIAACVQELPSEGFLKCRIGNLATGGCANGADLLGKS